MLHGAFALVALLAGHAEVASDATAVATDGAIEFISHGELVTRYYVAADVAKPYFWPMNAPGQVPVTRDWPIKKGLTGETTDHVHQKSAWFCHGDVVPADFSEPSKIKGVKGIDFWSEQSGHGVITCTMVGKPVLKPGRAAVTTKNVWKSAGGKVVLDEERTVELVDLGTARLIIVGSVIRSAGGRVEFADTKEGAFGVRVSDRLCLTDGKNKPLNPTSVLTNSNRGVGERDCWGRFADWCDYSGTIDGKPVGIAIFDDPANKPRACWHVRSYGLMAANPFGRLAHAGFPDRKKEPAEPTVTLSPGESLRLKYGILLHSGDASQVAEHFRKFVSLVN